MGTVRKLPDQRIPIADESGVLPREWHQLLKLESHIGKPDTTAVAGAGTLPATPKGFITMRVNNVEVSVPFYGKTP